MRARTLSALAKYRPLSILSTTMSWSSVETCVRAPADASTAVLERLPLTAMPLQRLEARLAPPSPTRSRLASMRWLSRRGETGEAMAEALPPYALAVQQIESRSTGSDSGSALYEVAAAAPARRQEAAGTVCLRVSNSTVLRGWTGDLHRGGGR